MTFSKWLQISPMNDVNRVSMMGNIRTFIGEKGRVHTSPMVYSVIQVEVLVKNSTLPGRWEFFEIIFPQHTIYFKW